MEKKRKNEMDWILFADKLPKHNQYIKVKSDNLWHGEGIFQDGKFVYSWVKGACFGNPTHWMELPKPSGFMTEPKDIVPGLPYTNSLIAKSACLKRGCRNLETRCLGCGRLVCNASIPSPWIRWRPGDVPENVMCVWNGEMIIFNVFWFDEQDWESHGFTHYAKMLEPPKE